LCVNFQMLTSSVIIIQMFFLTVSLFRNLQFFWKAFVYVYCPYVRVGQNCTLMLFFISGLFVGAMYVSNTCPELNPSGFVVTNIWMINNKYIDCHLRVISLTCFLLSLPLIFLMWVTDVIYPIKRSHVVSFRNVNLMFELFDAVFCVW